MKVLLFHINSFEEHGDNPRVQAYFQYLNSNGHETSYASLGNKNSGFFRKFTCSIGYAFNILIGKTKADLCYFYAPNFLFFPIYWTARLKRIPMVIEKTELDSIRPDKGFKDRLVRFSYWLDEKWASLWVFKSVVISDKLAQHYQKKYKAIYTCPAFTDTSLFPEPTITDRKTIGYLGSFGSKDDVKGIVDAFLIARQQVADLKLKLIGDFPPGIEFPGKKTIEITGLVSSEKLPQELQSCDLLISNRSNHPYSSFGSPTKLVEYLASGIPVIATPTGSISSSLQDGIHLRFTPADKSHQLAEAIIDRYQNNSMYQQMAQKGRILCQNEMDVGNVLPGWLDFISGPNS